MVAWCFAALVWTRVWQQDACALQMKRKSGGMPHQFAAYVRTVDSHAKGNKETTQTHSHSRHVVTPTRPLAELYTHGVTAKKLRSRVIPMDHPQTKGHEPMRPDPAEALRPLLSAAQ